MAPRVLREILFEGNIARVPLTRGYEAIIDAEDVPLIQGRSWCAVKGLSGIIYAKSSVGRHGALYMHRVIAGSPISKITDHKDGNGLNNRRSNLRVCGYSQNAANKKARASSSSGLKGVCWDKNSGKWQATIRVNGRETYLGQYATKEEAHAVYVVAGNAAYGEFFRP